MVCNNLIALDLGSCEIGFDAFQYCSKLQSIGESAKCTSVDYYAFSGCIYNHRTTKTNQKYPSVNL